MSPLTTQLAFFAALGHPSDEFQRGRRQVFTELADILTITEQPA